MKTSPSDEIQACELPNRSYLRNYKRDNHFTDCYSTTVDLDLSSAQFVEAFYTTWLFKLERLIIAIFVLRPSTDKQLFEFLRFRRSTFSAWTIERSSEEQWLMCDYQGKKWTLFIGQSFQIYN